MSRAQPCSWDTRSVEQSARPPSPPGGPRRRAVCLPAALLLGLSPYPTCLIASSLSLSPSLSPNGRKVTSTSTPHISQLTDVSLLLVPSVLLSSPVRLFYASHPSFSGSAYLSRQRSYFVFRRPGPRLSSSRHPVLYLVPCVHPLPVSPQFAPPPSSRVAPFCKFCRKVLLHTTFLEHFDSLISKISSDSRNFQKN